MSEKHDFIEEGDGVATITFSRKRSINGAEVGFIVMREPTVNDQLVADKLKVSSGEQEVAIFSNLCECAPDDIRKLPLRDYKRLQLAYVSFID